MGKIIRYIILANGDFPVSERTLGLLENADRVICCDGAIAGLKKIRRPDCIVGDLDSISPEDAATYKDLVRHISEQETNDMSKAFKVLTEELIPEDELFEITILGATGKREDHTLGNISLLPRYTAALTERFGNRGSIRMVTEYGEFIAIHQSTVFDRKPGTRLSLFSFDPTLRLVSEGLKYQTREVVFDEWWKATLNITEKRVFSLIMNHPAPVIIYFPL